MRRLPSRRQEPPQRLSRSLCASQSHSPSRSRLQHPPEQPLSTYQPLRDRSPYQFDDNVDYGGRLSEYGEFPMSTKERDRYVREYVPNDYRDAAARHKPSSLKRHKKGEQHKRYSQPLDGAYDANRFVPLDPVTGAGHRPLDGSYDIAGAPNRSLDGAAPVAQHRPLDATYDSIGAELRPLDGSYDSTGAARIQSRPLDYSTGAWDKPRMLAMTNQVLHQEVKDKGAFLYIGQIPGKGKNAPIMGMCQGPLPLKTIGIKSYY